MKTTFIIGVLLEEPVRIEGHIHIRASSPEKALEKLARWGQYQVLDVREKG